MGRIISPRFFVVHGSEYCTKIRIKLRPSHSETLSAKVIMGFSSGGAVSEAD